jgi:hypothetical protein
MNARRLVARVPLVVLTAILGSGTVLAANTLWAGPAGAAKGIVKGISCGQQGSTTSVGVFVISCGGPGASDVSVVADSKNISDGAAKGQAVDLTITPKGSSSTGSTTISGVDVSESMCTTAQGVITLDEPGTAGVTVTLTVARTDGGSIDHVSGGQPNQDEGLMAVKGQGPANVSGKGSKC